MLGPERPWEFDAIAQQPRFARSEGRAWLIDRETIDQGAPLNACEAQWLIEAPWAHPISHSYLLSLVHLRERTGLPAPVRTLKGATHEIVLFALDPAFPRADALERGVFHPLGPANFVSQFIETGFGEAVLRVELAVKAICTGLMSPDTDYTAQWTRLFGSNTIALRVPID